MPTKTGKPTNWNYTHCYSDCRPNCSTSLTSNVTPAAGLPNTANKGTRPITVINPPNPPRLPPSVRALQLKRISRFEKHMTAYNIPRTRWAAELRTLLQGDLTSVALSISMDQADCSSTLKKAILTRLGITQSARFSAWLDPNPRSSETVSQVYHRTLDVALTCLRDCNSIEDCATLITQEVVYRQLQPLVAQFVRAQKPPTAQYMVQAADAWVAEGKFDRFTAWHLEKS